MTGTIFGQWPGQRDLAAAANQQFSVLDGWWDEAYDGSNGWALPSGSYRDLAADDARHAVAFYDMTEREIVSTFYQSDSRAWLNRVRWSLATLMPGFSTRRMLDEYVHGPYGA